MAATPLRKVVSALSTMTFPVQAWQGFRGTRRWKRVEHLDITSPRTATFCLDLRAVWKAPPLDSIDWPAGRVLLQLLLDTLPLRDAKVLELGAGIGTTAVGLAIATSNSITAVDHDRDALQLLQKNAQRNGVTSLHTALWDAAGGRDAAQALPESVGASLTHVVGSDLVYHGGAEDASVADDKNCGRGLASTLAALATAHPDVEMTLLLVERFPRPAASIPAEHAGNGWEGRRDPALVAFERRCASNGLRFDRVRVPDDTQRRVHEAQWPWMRAAWWLNDTWDTLWVYKLVQKSDACGRKVDMWMCARA